MTSEPPKKRVNLLSSSVGNSSIYGRITIFSLLQADVSSSGCTIGMQIMKLSTSSNAWTGRQPAKVFRQTCTTYVWRFRRTGAAGGVFQLWQLAQEDGTLQWA